MQRPVLQNPALQNPALENAGRSALAVGLDVMDSGPTDELNGGEDAGAMAGGSGVAGIAALCERAFDRLIDLAALIAALLVIGLGLWVTYDVAMRYLFLTPTSFLSDLSEYALVWITFLAAPWVLRRQAHVRIDVLIGFCSPPVQQVLARIAAAIGVLVCLIMAWKTGVTTYGYFERGVLVARVWQVPQYLTYLPIPLGCAIMAVEFLRRLVKRT